MQKPTKRHPTKEWGALSGWGGRTLCNVALPEGGEESQGQSDVVRGADVASVPVLTVGTIA